MANLELAEIFREIAEILEIQGENAFKVRAYYRVVQILESLPEEIDQIYNRGELHKIPGVGAHIAQKIEEYIKTGKIGYHEHLRKNIPSGLLKMLEIPDVGPKTVKLLYEKLKIDSISKLEKAIAEKKIRSLPGMGEKSEENIKKGIEFLRQQKGRMLLGNAHPLAMAIIEELKKEPGVERISPAGSLRRMKETIGDIDILITSKSPKKVMETFIHLPMVTKVNNFGETKSSVIMEDKLQVDLRVVEPDSFGAALQYFTGSKSHNIKLRDIAKDKGYKINEYGLFRIKDNKKIAGKEEKDIYNALGLDYIPPEMRENRGEIEISMDKKLPNLLKEKDIRGDLHLHSKWSDGHDSIEDMARACMKIGYEYMGITDHSHSLKVAGGLSVSEAKKQLEEIRELNRRLKGFRVLAGCEVDILGDGTIDYPDDILGLYDFVIASIHTGFKQDREVLTERVIKAMHNPYVNIIAHPTGRLLEKREPYAIDLEAIFREAQNTNTYLELNAYPDRLDLSDIYLRHLKGLGLKVVLGSDAHSIIQLKVMIYGVATARRGWLEKRDVLNTLKAEELLKIFNRKKSILGV